ncbi:hypothetical protein [Parabacteroides johnsonii]|uniref:hypothetical protein n=1 Tax=Parabacteroides johnsonii TaxID=387661 RepID=UPI001C8CDBEA|nr:hypothetical protein [Parabacteroides johnsonii]
MKVSIGTDFTLFSSDPFATRIVSKTADIKQALVLGVHGPVGVLVMLIDRQSLSQ